MHSKEKTVTVADLVPDALARAAALAILVAAALLPGGCRQTPAAVVHSDLLAEAPFARWVQASGDRAYISPPATLYDVGPRGKRFGAQPRLISNAILEWLAPRPREVVLDIERPAWGSGDVQVTLNRTLLGELPLGQGRESHALSLPVAAQRSGINRLRLTFPGDASSTRPPPSGPPVRLHGVSVRSPGQVAPPPANGVRTEPGGSSTLALAAGSGLEYALSLPEEAEFRFTPRFGEGQAPASFRVELTLEDRPTRELTTVDLRPGEAISEVRVPLPGASGRPALLGLHVSADPGAGVVIGEWEAPRVLGRPRPSPPQLAEPSTSLEGLHRRLTEAGVLLIFLDAAAARHFGCYGYHRNTTPEIDRLAAEAAVFEQAYSPASFTGLAMASLWTSQHPEQHHHGVSPRDRLPPHRVVLAELLRARDVPATAFIGNIVAGEAADLTRGFTEEHPLRLSLKHNDEAGPADSGLVGIEASISRADSGRFLTYVHYREPHFPYDPPPPFDAMFGSTAPVPPALRSWMAAANAGRVQPTEDVIARLVRLYDGNLAAVDHEIGLLRRRLESVGRWDDLVVIVTADHGESFWEHGQFSHSAQIYEESVRIPLIIKLPGEYVEPTRISDPVDLLDLGATLADILGVAEPAGAGFEGRSLLPLLAGGTLAPRPLVARTLAERPEYSFFDGRLKLIHDPKWGGSELYDVWEDRGEQHDLSGTRPLMTELLRQSLYRWLRSLDRGEPAGEARPIFTPETEDALRALGYID